MHPCHKSVFVSAGLLLLISAMVHANENDILKRVKRDSEAESDGDEEVFDNIYSALSDAGPAAREKRQHLAASRIQSQQQSRDGRQVKNAIPGFPTGLPSQVPEGVRIALESAQIGPDGEFIMNPIPGQAGVDFPVLASVPQTSFDCNAQKFPGIYSDVDADCQVFHMCQPNGNSDSFLCPNGTVFNQQYFICDWWYNVDCSANPSFYALNEFIYQDQPEGNNL